MRQRTKENLALFLIGGTGYGVIEIAARGYTHWSMVLLGGACVVGFRAICRRIPNALPPVKALAGAVLITLGELAVGLLVNRGLGWAVWDYADEWANVQGQICPLYSFYWFCLCLVLLDGAVFLRWALTKSRAAKSAFRPETR